MKENEINTWEDFEKFVDNVWQEYKNEIDKIKEQNLFDEEDIIDEED